MNNIIENLRSCHTYKEVQAQPQIWRKWATEIDGISSDIGNWIIARNPQEIWFCGAGTSAFIGDTLSAYLSKDKGRIYRTVSTTDFVASPHNFPQTDRKILVVSFGRSGASSETIAMLDILDQHYGDADRLNITCDASSPLATRVVIGTGQQQTIVLPAETLDKGFAMTSSYTTMLLSALACLDQQPPGKISDIFTQLADQSSKILANLPNQLADKLSKSPKRCIFLGSGSLKGTARESALKILELTAGQTVTQWDSSLGFRHGPKAIIDADTQIYVLVSNDEYTQKYDLDIAKEIKQQYEQATVITVGMTSSDVDIRLGGSDFSSDIAKNDAWSSVLYILIAQTLCMHWSAALGLNVDNPFAGQGNLTRVVTGVTIYPF